jgi:hypothetical protein
MIGTSVEGVDEVCAGSGQLMTKSFAAGAISVQKLTDDNIPPMPHSKD